MIPAEAGIPLLAVIIITPPTGARLHRVPTYLCKPNKAFATRLI